MKSLKSVTVIREFGRAPCWRTFGRTKVLILVCSFSALVSMFIAYETDDEDPSVQGRQTYRNINRANGNFIISSLLVTFVVNASLSAIHLGEWFYPTKFITEGGHLVTSTWTFRFAEVSNGLFCSILLLGSACSLLFTDPSLNYHCTKWWFCTSTTAALLLTFVTVVTTMANFMIGLCETLKNVDHIMESHLIRPLLPPSDDDMLLRQV